MSKKNILIGVGITGLLYAAYRSWNIKASVDFFEYSISSLKVNLRNPLQPQLLFGVQIYNPNKTAVPVTEFFGTIKNNGTMVASFKSVSKINLGGNETKVVDVNTRVNVLSVLSKILNKSGSPVMQIDGIIKTPFFDMPITKQVNFSTLISGVDDGVGRSRFMEKIRQRLEAKRNGKMLLQGTLN